MRQHAISIRVLAVAWVLLASASVVQAANETRVSGAGTDAGNCPIAAFLAAFVIGFVLLMIFDRYEACNWDYWSCPRLRRRGW